MRRMICLVTHMYRNERIETVVPRLIDAAMILFIAAFGLGLIFNAAPGAVAMIFK